MTDTGKAQHWEHDALASDGHVVRIRSLDANDHRRFVDFHEQLTPEDRYRRFFTNRLPTEDVLCRPLHSTLPGDFALAVEEDGAIIAIGTSAHVEDGSSAEVAFAVAFQHQHRGLGTLLLEHLAAMASAAGIQSFHATTLPYNAEMLEVFERAGYKVDYDADRDEVRVSFALDDSADASIDSRDRRAAAQSIHRILAPRTVAVIGASRTPGTVGHALFNNIIRGGFQGTVFPVNPHASSVSAVSAYRSVAEIDQPIDLAVIAVPTAAVPAVLDECGHAGVHSAVIVTAGFAEAGGESIDAEFDLLRCARQHGMRLVGPNCIGIVNTHPEVQLNATFSPIAPVPGAVSFASQSGALGIAVLDHAARAGMGVASFVSLGNKADVSGNDLLQYWESDAQTAVGVLYLESFGNPRKFARIARRFCAVKPLVVMKSGRSAAGKRAASSHTAALSSDDDLSDALFRQAGIIRVDTLAEVFDVTRLLTSQPIPVGNRVAIVGNSGGPGILAADACEGAGLSVPELSPETMQALRALLPPGAGVSNPVDLIANARGDAYEAALDLVLADDGVDAVLVIYTDPMISEASDIMHAIGRVASRRPDKPIAANFLAADVPTAIRATDTGGSHAEIPIYDFPEAAIIALGHAARLGMWRQHYSGTSEPLSGIDRARAHDCITEALTADHDGGWLTPDQISELLGTHAIALTPAKFVDGPDEAADAATLLGAPVALKLVSPTIVHKTDVGGVQLGLRSEDEVRAAYTHMKDVLGDAMTGAIVQPMAPTGAEFIVGAVTDPTFGPVVMFGAGGTSAELWADRSFALAPLTTTQAAELIQAPRSSALLRGYRGAPVIDPAELEELVTRLGLLMDHVPEIAELDLNPVIATPTGLHIVDARCRITAREATSAGPRRHLERREPTHVKP